MISFPQNLVLEDERVLMRPMEKSDVDFLAPFAINESDIWQFYLTTINSRNDMEQYINITVDQRGLQKEYPFIIFDKKASAYAGSSRFYDIQLHNLATQLGYTWYEQKFQRTGLNRNCKFLLLQFAFEEWGLERVEFRADANNKKSVDAMKAIGCTVEGILRSHTPTYTGLRRNSIVLSILKDEWFSHIKENLEKKIYNR